ncbi:hypothetical protein HJG60_009137 [Phyllostomus discolor]|uniref:Uncharacterized protein n=1 Tax=Phyllostomus discolor TaxID=89673 RepID=A0A833YMB8_9CHIR|nr:hypothetical protein HJG60_009137 [Phyllostomus discolor]
MVSPKVISPTVHALHSRPRPAPPRPAAPSSTPRSIPRPTCVLIGPPGVGVHCGGGDFTPRHSWKPPILHFPVVNDDKKANSFLGFCLRTFYTYICIYVCVCMDICMYMHMYMYICIYPSQYKYSPRESCKYSLVTCLSASRRHSFDVMLTTPCTD